MEIQGQENRNSATFVMGKYLTPDQFITCEHSVGALEEDRTPQVMTIEYELTKYFFLQLISGDTKTTRQTLSSKLINSGNTDKPIELYTIKMQRFGA